ncbi:recombinase family protein [Sphingobium xenophagum]|uniref:recombinase family protein n=1 Tax=Sphingobium xenophagum TaxID=121428 RepID=UPI0003823D04|nr:recombinase family protein [Sphingobium xenophagum]
MKRTRCAIYTRKSSDEGLEQAFNSLDAQREACSAYILSQASEGWSELSERYDDGGLSGGTLERPAIQRLLSDIASGRIDIVVVYKVDRLTRSLLDFSKLVEAFDKAGVSFVSVTQSFNTTTSMGRLTLNMLLSFAQFEREVTAERIRDKIAASKAKGMWMGGIPPLGYRADGRSLAVVDEHAALVRRIFDRYLELRSVRLLADELQAQDVAVPRRSTASGKALGGGSFSRGQLYHILSRVTYVGDIPHRDITYPGNHPPIIDRETFARAQQLLAGNNAGVGTRHSTNRSILAGRIFDADSEALLAVHTLKAKVRYRYYVSRALHHKQSDTGMRIPAREIEALVSARLVEILNDPMELLATGWLNVPPDELNLFSARCREVAAEVQLGNRSVLTALVTRVQVLADRVEIMCDVNELAAALRVARPEAGATAITLHADVRVTRSGRVLRLVQGGRPSTGQIDGSLVKMLVRARRWWAELRTGDIDVSTIATREGITRSYVCRVVRLAFLSPEMIEAVLLGSQDAAMTVAKLVRSDAIAASWSDQKRMVS